MSAWLYPWTEAIGFWAAALTTVGFVPQVIETWRSGGQGVSWWMLALFGAGVGLWFLYGFLRSSAPVMVANGLTGLEVLIIVSFKGWRALQSSQ